MKSMFRIFLQLVLVFLVTEASSQERYNEVLFDEINVETHTYATKDGENLVLDVYSSAFDVESERALILYVHGGGFQAGERNSEDIEAFCRNLAGYGYLTVSMSYRLTRKDKETKFGCDCPEIEKRSTFQAAVEDVQDATYYLIENREVIGFNPQKIILAGSSAGAETVLNTAYQPPYCYGLDSGPVSYAGVISMAGAIPDTTSIFEDSAIPSLLFHGTNDDLVPYATAPHHYCNESDPGYLILHGAHTIAKKLTLLNVPNWLHTTCGGGHELSWKPMKEYFDEILDFCYNFVILENGDTRHTVVQGKQDILNFETFNFCEE